MLKQIRDYFLGTVDELQKYRTERKDPIISVLFLGEIAALCYTLQTVENSNEVAYWAIPFGVDFIVRGGYAAVHSITERRAYKKKTGLNETDLDKILKPFFPPGIVGIIRQKGKYQAIDDKLD